jgi:hypothetical protein
VAVSFAGDLVATSAQDRNFTKARAPMALPLIAPPSWATSTVGNLIP